MSQLRLANRFHSQKNMYGGGGKGGEMTQILYAHMNKRY
jgi:hypothetical protein